MHCWRSIPSRSQSQATQSDLKMDTCSMGLRRQSKRIDVKRSFNLTQCPMYLLQKTSPVRAGMRPAQWKRQMKPSKRHLMKPAEKTKKLKSPRRGKCRKLKQS